MIKNCDFSPGGSLKWTVWRLSAVLTLVAVGTGVAWGQVTNFFNNTGPAWNDPLNWDSGLPDANTTFRIGGSFLFAPTTALIDGHGAVSNAGIVGGDNASEPGRLFIQNGGSLDVAASILLGRYTYGRISLFSGGRLSASQIIMGIGSGGEGLMEVSGAGSQADLGNMYIGRRGLLFSLEISDGGRVNLGTGALVNFGEDDPLFVAGDGGSIMLTGTPGARGTIRAAGFYRGSGLAEISIDGGVIEINADNAELFSGFVAGSVSLESGGAWFDTLGNDAGTLLGLVGAGALTKSGAGELTLSGANTYAGGTTVSQGTLRIDGGSISHASADTVVGSLAGDSGTLVIANGGTVSNQDAVLGDDAGATGTATVTGAGSVWNNGGDVFVGNAGTGTLTLAGGGQANASGAFTLANHAGSTGILNLGAGGAAGMLDTASVNGGAGGAVLNFNHSDAGYFFTRDGTAGGTEVLITGGTSVNHLGSGATILTGTHTYSGGTFVQSGTLRVNGVITGDTFVQAGGTLGGSGTLGNLTVNTGGRLAPGNSPGILTIVGDLTLAPSSVTAMEIDGPIPGTQHDQINVSGTATLDGTLDLVLGAPLAAGDSFNLINAGNLVLAGDPTMGFANITGNFGAALVPTPVIGLTTFDIVFNQGSFVAVAPGPLTFNQRAVASALDTLAASAQAPALVAQLNQLAAGALPPTFDALSGVQHTLAQSLAVKTGQAFHSAVVKCLDDTAGSATHGRVANPTRARGCGLWGELTASIGDIDGDANARGADYRSGGFTFGVDTELGNQLIVGAALGYTRTDIDPVAGDLEVGSVQGALYGGWQNEAWYARASAGFGAHDFSADRRVAVGAVGGTASADYDGWTAVGGLEVGRSYGVRGMHVTPFAGLEYTHLRRERFSEHGAGAADLEVASERADSLRSLLGARLASRFATASGMKIAPIAEVAWVRETLDDDARLTAAFAGTTGATFRIKGPELDRDRARLSAAVTAQLSKTADLHVAYAGEIAGSDAGHTFSAGYRMAW